MDFEHYIDGLEEVLCSLGNVQTKPINYGVQIVLTGNGEKATLNVYNGKKGIKTVWGGGASGLKTQAMALLRPQIQGLADKSVAEETAADHGKNNRNRSTGPVTTGSAPLRINMPRILLQKEAGFPGLWMGSDESGKGDYFGPLVVAAVCLDRQGAEKLIEAGVRDCKDLSDKQVFSLVQCIEDTALAQSVLVMKPGAYNMRYKQVREAGGTLNEFLSYGHIAALKQTWKQYPSCRWALVDQFARKDRITDGTHEFCPSLRVVLRPRAEEDIAVACASVLARAAFLRTLAELTDEAAIGKLPKGGGNAATQAAQRLVRSKGKEALSHFVKLHFANTRKL